MSSWNKSSRILGCLFFLLVGSAFEIACTRSEVSKPASTCCCEFQEGPGVGYVLTDDNTCIGERPGGKCIVKDPCE